MGLKTSIQQEKIIFSYILKKPEYLMFISKDFFSNDDIQYIASMAKSFYKEYKESPSCEQMLSLLVDNNSRDISMDSVRSIYDVEINSYDNDWLKQTTEAWIIWRTLNTKLVDGVSLLKTTDVSLDNVVDVVNKVVDIISSTTLVSFDKDLGSNFFDVDSHKSVKSIKIPYTWKQFNKWSKGGLDPKTLTCYIGATNVGKSVFLCNDAASFVRKGKNVVYLSCEMSASKVNRRIGVNLFDITLDEYDEYVENPKKVNKMLNKLNDSLLPMGKLFVKELPTGQGTVLDVEKYIREIEETQKFKVDVVIIDYINIMCNYRFPNSESTYMKIKQIAEDLRGIAVKYNLSIITATQCGRSALNSSDINMEDVAESMGLLHTVDTCFGIIQTDNMRMGVDNLDSDGKPLPYYWLKILKIREGEGRDEKFKINAIYPKMKLIESEDKINTLSHFA